MRKANPSDLLYVSKLPKDRLDLLAAGASLVARTGYGVKQLQVKAANDRLQLATLFLEDAKSLHSNGTNLNRTAVSRAYYAMYHALRAATYINYGGDDHEQHTVLPSKVPNDFPECAKWQNSLKNARLERNKADYDPYPRKDNQFRNTAIKLIGEATILISHTRLYIRSKS